MKPQSSWGWLLKLHRSHMMMWHEAGLRELWTAKVLHPSLAVLRY